MGTFFGDDAETAAAIAELREQLRAEVREELLAVRREVAEIRSAETVVEEPASGGGHGVSRRSFFRVGGAALVGATAVGAGLVAAAGPAAAVGASVYFLSTPIRLVDTRDGTGVIAPHSPGASVPLTPGAFMDVQITGVTVGTVSIPAGAVGVFGTVTVTETGAPGGDLTLYPEGIATPTASNVNWYAAGQTVATAAIVGLSTTGQLTIINGGLGQTSVIFDAAGYVM